MYSVFISYRRSDSFDITGRVYDRLVQHFGKDQVYTDVGDYPDGTSFTASHEDIIKNAKVELVIIGPGWLNASFGRFQQRRLNDKHDRVRVEIEVALAAKTRIIPILVRDAAMPRPQDLPRSLRPLTERTGMQVHSDANFNGDMTEVIKAVEHIINLPPPTVESEQGQSQEQKKQQRSPIGCLLLLIVALIVAATGVYLNGRPNSLIPSSLPQPPTAAFTQSESGSFWNCTMNFDASGSNAQGGITDYSWDFGDGTSTDTGSDSSASHSFGGNSGTYTVTLTVTDEDGQRGTATESVDYSSFLWC